MKVKKFLTEIYKGKYVRVKKDGKCVERGIAIVFAEIASKQILNMQVKAIEPINDEMIEIVIGEENG